MLLAVEEARLFSLDFYIVSPQLDQLLQIETQLYCVVSSSEKEV
jgi:hypothetical protein